MLESGNVYLVGRGEECDLPIEDERISRRHARISSTPAGWLLTDLGSKNGTSVNGLPVDEPAELPHPSWLSFGGLPVRFEHLAETSQRDEERSRAERWRTTLTLERELVPGLGSEELTEKFLTSVLRLSGADRGFVLLARGDGDLEVAAAVGVDLEELATPRFSGSVGAVERVLAGEVVVATSDAWEDTRLGGRESVVAGGIRGMVCLPLKVQDHLLGVLYVDSAKPGVTFTELDVGILEALASHTALALSVAHVDRELKRLARSLAAEPELSEQRRRSFQQQLETLWSRASGSAGGGNGSRRGRGTTWHAILSAHGPEAHP